MTVNRHVLVGQELTFEFPGEIPTTVCIVAATSSSALPGQPVDAEDALSDALASVTLSPATPVYLVLDTTRIDWLANEGTRSSSGAGADSANAADVSLPLLDGSTSASFGACLCVPRHSPVCPPH